MTTPQKGDVPEEAVLASLGCGNPTALAELTRARRCSTSDRAAASTFCCRRGASGPGGKAYGLDMTDEMLALARENQKKAGVENVEFLKGEIEKHSAAGQFGGRDHLELRDQSFGGQGSCAARSLPRAEAGRPLRGLGRGDPGRDPARDVREAHAAVGRAAWRARWRTRTISPSSPQRAFEDIEIEPTRVYGLEDARAFLSTEGIDVDAIAPQVDRASS